MASDLREELNCSICLSIYTDPVTLACGHNFCRVCIGSVLDTQEGSGVYSCPECRETFNTRPAMHRNLKLRNIMTLLLPTHPEQEETGIFCTYCIHSPVPATKSCLHCEASLCDNHVRVHSKSEEHVLSEPTTSWGNRKCSVHKKLLEYYCSEDAACICVSCSLAGDHRGHKVELLKEASEKKKKKLRNVLEKLTSKREKTERRVQRLQEHRREVQERAAGVTETVTALIRDIRRQLEVLEKRVLSEVTWQEEKVLLQVSDLIQQLEKEKDELSGKISHIEELCTMTDPLLVLQDQESHNDDFCDTEKGNNEDTQREDKQVPDGGGLDEGLISETLYRGLDDIVTDVKVKRGIYVQEASDILLDVNTAANNLTVSGDLKTVTLTEINQKRPETPERFQYYQVLSTRSFSSGRHYWEVETSVSGGWRVGMCYPSIERRGRQSWIANNNKSCMASDLREELNCSICLSIYTDPVTLACGHNFCQVCIGSVLDTQEGSGVYSCPECRETFNTRPAMHRNLKLRNIMTLLLPTHPEQEETGIFCTYCIHSPVPATKSCLMCEASLCDNHVRVHSKSEEHVLSEPTTSWGNRKCSVHKKLLEYYCSEDAACICVSCSLAGDHRGHQVELLKEASEKKKRKLRNVLEKLTSKRQETKRRVQRLQEHRREVQERAAGVTETVTALIRDIRRQLEVLEKRVLSEITRQEEKVLLQVSELIQQLEKGKDELSRKMSHIEELSTMTDPLPVLQDQESHNDDFCDTEKGDNEDTQREDRKVPAGGDLDEGLISETLYRGFDDIVTDVKVKREVYVQKGFDILLDVNTAANNVTVSGDLKTVTLTEINQKRPETPERFQYYQVLSTRSFSSGRHYWEVETRESGGWRVGMCYPSIERRGRQSWIANNNKSWCLCGYNKALLVSHDSVHTQLPLSPSCHRYRISLDYEAGRLSFYELCDPIRHLHTFTATFTEPLCGAFWVCGTGGWVRIRS
ncbi:LOW QUALITY PROTEIN: E3 ubiquitin/ISG15 ligase TRIM25-like [Discoglossus pictus]